MKPKFEPIDYEEEINFSLQTPEHLQKPQKQKEEGNPKDQEDDQKQKKNANPTIAQDETIARCDKQDAITSTTAPLSPNSPPEPCESKEHRVTAMVHRSSNKTVNSPTDQTTQKVQSEDLKKEKNPQVTGAIKSQIHSSTPLRAERRNSLMAMVKHSTSNAPVGSVLEPPTATSDKKAVLTSPETASSSHASSSSGAVSFKIPVSPKTQIPLLPPPPASNKIRVGNAQILRPTPASPHQRISPARNKSKSLPRGLPSDGSVFAGFSDPICAKEVVSGSTGRSQCLNPFAFDGAEQDESETSDETNTEEEEDDDAKVPESKRAPINAKTKQQDKIEEDAAKGETSIRERKLIMILSSLLKKHIFSDISFFIQ